MLSTNCNKLLKSSKPLIVCYRSLKKIDRGQNPEVVSAMPVFQFTQTDQMPLNRKKRLYCWGYAGGGALGYVGFIRRRGYIGEPPLSPIMVKRSPHNLRFINQYTEVIDVSAGYGFTVIAAVARDSSHRVFGCGVNTDSQIGCQLSPAKKPLISAAQPLPIPLPIDVKDKVTRVACGRAHTICLTNRGQLFSFGNNAFGQCGRTIIDDEVYFGINRINQIKSIDGKVIDIICGQDHSLFLTETGEVYSCGWGADGQTGLGHYDNCAKPTKVKGDIDNEKIVSLSSAADCVLAINENGDVFGWGNSEYSQLTSITNAKQSNIPRHLKLKNIGKKVVSVAAGGSLCALVNDEGYVYVWGYGILGMGPKVDALHVPTMLPMPLFGQNQFNADVKVIKVEASLNHLAAITNKGELFMWGKNNASCLGLGHRADQYFPFRVCVPVNVRKVSLGVHHTFIIGTSVI